MSINVTGQVNFTAGQAILHLTPTPAPGSAPPGPPSTATVVQLIRSGEMAVHPSKAGIKAKAVGTAIGNIQRSLRLPSGVTRGQWSPQAQQLLAEWLQRPWQAAPQQQLLALPAPAPLLALPAAGPLVPVLLPAAQQQLSLPPVPSGDDSDSASDSSDSSDSSDNSDRDESMDDAVGTGLAAVVPEEDPMDDGTGLAAVVPEEDPMDDGTGLTDDAITAHPLYEHISKAYDDQLRENEMQVETIADQTERITILTHACQVYEAEIETLRAALAHHQA
jgi:hypothetical protein